MTNDVETTSLELNRPIDSMAPKVKNIGLPRLIDLYAKYDVEATFFFTGYIVEIMPDIVDIVKEHGHEIGCHGYRHENEYAFDNLTLEEQVQYLKKAKSIIERASGVAVYSFRAPELRINRYTPRALETAGFKYDSSVAPQRFDGPLSKGFKNKFLWLFAPRTPYYLDYNNPFKAGNSKILEIPISSFIFSFMGTTMRISPDINKHVQKIIFRESRKKGVPVTFLIHPNEVIDPDGNMIHKAENSNAESFMESLKRKIKYKNLGSAALKLTEEILRDAKRNDFEFVSIAKFAQLWRDVK